MQEGRRGWFLSGGVIGLGEEAEVPLIQKHYVSDRRL
jgi:hypothetical protein